MDGVFRGMTPTECLVYLDDVIVFGGSIEEHAARLGRVFERLESARNRVKPYFGPIPPPSLGTADRRPGRPRKERASPPSQPSEDAAVTSEAEWECEGVGVVAPAVGSDDGWDTAEEESSCSTESPYIPPTQVHPLPPERSPYYLRSSEPSVDPPPSPLPESAGDPSVSPPPPQPSPLGRSPYFLRPRAARPSVEGV
ncbi:splicing factor 1-like [Ischnura elegans]|uniref:splicing factor 1-like n=1 Tax=Ischnura elegans TaxID=197161 RepID=UPI001ED889EF|nr:splicing factor 1-like [Ischnura elegans]